MTHREWSAVVLAGGKGTRLMPLTSDIPKPIVKVTNEPMVDYAIAHLIYAGIKHIVVALAHMGEELKAYIENVWTPERLGDVILECEVQKSKGTADALRLLTGDLDSDNIVVSMADIVTNLPMREFMDFHIQKGGMSTISMKSVESHTSQYGVVLLDENRKIYLFLEKPAPMELYVSSMAQRNELYLHTNVINTGIYCFKKEILKILDDTDLMDFGGEVFPYLLENEYDLYGFVKDYYWLDCGNPKTYLWANWDMLRKYAWPITPKGKEYDGIWVTGIINSGHDVIIKKPTCFGDYVQLDDNITIHELSSIGTHVKIKKNTQIRKSVIWDNVNIGSDCEIIESIISNDCEIGNNVRLERSVIGPHCKINSNTKLEDETLSKDQEV
ncbi:MAG: NTP transferase domain-containing protein [Candidatus Lokiarchaeota archaeon]|nr:NTP transferase domain-containing protein [Candidatus Lokiarchaeota archaeon]MBD3200749.1 NTP transferase domain-containing protein [Candidatus Lokiarchaeota archaeon]